MSRILTAALLLWGAVAFCQESNWLRPGSKEIGFWIGGGARVVQTGNQFVMGAVRVGFVLTRPRGPSILRGNLQYSFDVAPAFLVFSEKPIYGFEISPFLLKYNFSGNGKIMPYVEGGAGFLYTNHAIPYPPAGTSQINFTPQAAFGLQFPTSVTQGADIAVKWLHISNANLKTRNPGENSIQFLFGYHWIH
jgi:lipid A 3-O-deacylase